MGPSHSWSLVGGEGAPEAVRSPCQPLTTPLAVPAPSARRLQALPRVRAFGHAKRALEAAAVCLGTIGGTLGPDPDALLLEASTPTDPVRPGAARSLREGCCLLCRFLW